MSLLLSILGKKGGTLEAPAPPMLILTSAVPTQAVVTASGYTTYEYQVSSFVDFSEIIETNTTGIFANLGAGDFKFRARGTDGLTPSRWSNRIDVNIAATPLRSLTISANGEIDQVRIVHDCANGEPHVDYVSVKRRLFPIGTYTEIGTFSPSTADYIDTTVINGVSYEYRLDLIPDSIDYIGSVSNQDEATSEAVTPTLSTPTSLTVTWSTETEGTGTFSWAAVTNATSYDVYLDGVFIQNVATTSRVFSSLTVGQAYLFGVVAKAAGYNNSPTATTQRTPIDLDNDFLSVDNEGGEPYYKPLDGRRELWNHRSIESFVAELVPIDDLLNDVDYGEVPASIWATAAANKTAYEAAEIAANRYTDYPLITYTPYTQMSAGDKAALTIANLAGTNYTKITCSESIFTDDDVTAGSRTVKFCGLNNHRNPVQSVFPTVDLYVPASVTARYANVVLRTSATTIYVDFEFNGGNRSTPQSQANGRGYIFVDNSQAFLNVFNAWKAPANTITNIKLANLEYLPNKVISAYVLQNTVAQFATGTINRNCKMYADSGRFRVKRGYEDYYQEEVSFFGAVKSITNPQAWINLNGHTGNFIIAGQVIAPHCCRTFYYSNFTTAGGGKLSGIVAQINGENYAEYDALERGQGVGGYERFSLTHSMMQGGGTYNATAVPLTDASAFQIELSYNCHYTGGYALGQKGGNSSRANIEVALYCTFDFEDQSYWQPNYEDNISVRVTSDKTTLPASVQSRSYYRGEILEILSDNGNWFYATAFGGTNRNGYCVFEHPTTGQGMPHPYSPTCVSLRYGVDAAFVMYYDFCYRGNEEINMWGGKDGQRFKEVSCTAKKMLTIETIAQPNTTYHVSREYAINKSDAELINSLNPQIPTIGAYQANAIRSAICWSTVLGKYANQFDNNDRAYMYDKVPIMLAAGATFTIPAYEGSTHDPNTIYTVDRVDRGVYPSFACEFITFNDSIAAGEYGAVNGQGYRYMLFLTSTNLPASLPVTFDIHVLTNPLADITDGNSYNALKIFYGNRFFYISGTPMYETGSPRARARQENQFDEAFWRDGDAFAHLAYTVGQVSRYALGCNFTNSFYRENGTSRNELALSKYNAGVYLVHCHNAPTGQFMGQGASPGQNRSQWNNAKAIHDANPLYVPPIYTNEGLPYPPKIGFYNTPSGSAAPTNPEIHLVRETSIANAPAPPTSVLNLLTSLGL